LFSTSRSVHPQRSSPPVSDSRGFPGSGAGRDPSAEALPDDAIITPSGGVYPRRRDLRRIGATTGSIPRVEAPVGTAFTAEPAGVVTVEAETDLARSRPRGQRGPAGEDAPASRSWNKPGTVNVARAAVLTMLVGAGYVTVSGTELDLPGISGGDLVACDDAADSLKGTFALSGTEPTSSEWDISSDLESIAVTSGKIEAEKAAAAKAAAAKAAAEKAAAEKAAAERERAMRDAQRNPKAYAKIIAAEDYGWTGSQFTCLDLLWTRESNWNYKAQNPSSGAYGIPQSLPGSKMATVASDWRTNPVTQIKWGLGYIKNRYGTPCGAWQHSENVGWY
jgi:hypothetical protein